ncbi:MAG: valine--tRNA ligase [Bacteroidetes bacterium]|nr:MAG: valine--tRNA ligase [Bacteroidota bacterium]
MSHDTTTPPAEAGKRAQYDPHAIEAKWYDYWERHGFFNADVRPDKKPHVIMMPPPNVTGRLHMGHALQDTIQDALTRLRRMQGYEALWMPGKDHAGIATQNVVERTLKEQEGLTRHDLGRERFLERVWDWVREYGDIILQQKRRLGDSCDWRRERFTMDERYARAVQRVFVQLYEEGLIYRGHYLVNWCPVDMTALSDEEVENVERDGHLWYIRYPLADGSGHITIATTRPETMLGDTAVAVHPEDERYAHLVGKKVRLPLLGREIPIIADEYVKKDFGAGALKVTPAHDKNDFEIGQRHGLEVVNIMNPDATINENGGPYAGLDRFEAREKIVADLEAQGLLEKVEPYKVSVPISHRSKAIIEPLLSRQWFVKMKPLAEPAIEAVRSGKITFYPKRWENEYFRWLENIRDWTISRQLWWGHRIPVWYYTDEHGEIDEERGFVVSVEQPEPGMVQDEDVLDTWFSSWLWPFATLGWPEDSEAVRRDLAYFYPGDVLVSGYDILFFWIARMIMAGLHFTGEIPFRDVFITGMIKDKYGRWMSKSLGNGIDPLEMIEQYGADAVRFSLTILCAQGQDIKLDPTKFEMGRNFANKIWNAFNVFGQFMETDAEGRPVKDYRRRRSFDELELVERWMLTRLHRTIEAVDEDIRRYRLNEALTKIYTLFWGDYCDWYLELIKPPYGEAMDEDKIALAVELYEKLLQLLHPFMPFITEELWWKLRPRREGEACIVSPWPRPDAAETDDAAAESFATLQEMVSGIRNVKSQYGVAPGKAIAARVNVAADAPALAAALQAHPHYFERLARVSDLTVGHGLDKPKASASVVVGKHEVYVPLAGMIDLDVERERLEKEIAQKERFLAGVERKLQNEQFVQKAPAEVVERERQKAADAKAELQRLRANLADLT